MKCLVRILLCLFLVNSISVSLALSEESQSMIPPSPLIKSSLVLDFDMAIADISMPFEVLDGSDWGWCVAQGILSDLTIDLDGDNQAERLIIYFAPANSHAASANENKIKDEDDCLSPFESEHALSQKDLRLAVFTQENQAFVKCTDIIIEPSLAFDYANIRVSVWGEGKRHIYVRSATSKFEGIQIMYSVLTFQDGKLICELALTDPGFTDAWGLYQVNVLDSAELYNISYSDGVAINVDYMDVGIDFSEEYTPLSQIDDENYMPYALCEPIYINQNYATVLQEYLADFGIEDKKDMSQLHCVPVCQIGYYLDYESHAERFRVSDHTGVNR